MPCKRVFYLFQEIDSEVKLLNREGNMGNTIGLVWKNIKNTASEEIFLRTRINLAKPVQIYGMVNEKCNCKCIMCDFWSRKQPAELSTDIWVRALLSLKELCGTYHINFSGGEPFLRKDMFYLLEVCQKNGIIFGITTNGLLLNQETANKLINLEPFNVNISFDGINETTHDYLRQTKGLLQRVKQGIDFLLKYKEEKNLNTRIILKPAVCKRNLKEMEEIVMFAKNKRLTGVSFQPIFKWTDGAENEWIDDYEMLESVVERLVQMKKENYPILTSVENIRSWIPHFKEAQGDSTMRSSCLVGVTNYQIRADGNVYLCSKYSPIGNVKDMSAKEIWYSDRAKKQRLDFLKCGELCLNACVAKKSIKDKVELFFRLVRKK